MQSKKDRRRFSPSSPARSAAIQDSWIKAFFAIAPTSNRAISPAARPSTPLPSPTPPPAASSQRGLSQAEQDRLRSAAHDADVEIANLCTLAGRPDLIVDFFRTKTSVASVRAQLQTIRANADAASATSGHILHDALSNHAQIDAGWDRAIANLGLGE